MPSKPKLVKIRPKYTPPPRGTTTERGYGHEHQLARRRYLAENPICERCRDRFATDLHHRDRDPFNRSPANFEALCEECHHGQAHAGGGTN